MSDKAQEREDLADFFRGMKKPPKPKIVKRLVKKDEPMPLFDKEMK